MKKLAFSLIAAGLSYLIIEIVAFSAHLIKFGDYNRAQLHIDKQHAISAHRNSGIYVAGQTKINEGRSIQEVLHPYVGYVVDGREPSPDCEPTSAESCLRRIRVLSDNALPKKKPQQLHIAILGGSFAEGFARLGKTAFIKALQQFPEFEQRDIQIHLLAAGGYKQPQQVTHLAFYYALGAEFDLVINIDGFNEATIPLPAWRDRGVHPAYPANWDFRVAQTLSSDLLTLYAKRNSIRQRHAGLASMVIKSPMRHSPLLNLIWRILDIRYQHAAYANEQKIVEETQSKEDREFNYVALGPDADFKDWPEFYRHIASLWANSSLALNALSSGMKTHYFHVLQPNQYIQGSKPLSVYEQNNAVLERDGYGNIYRVSYPYLIKEAERLEQSGINFHDMTFIFAQTPDTLYIDNCCHINAKGYQILGEKIGELVIDAARQQNLSF